MLTALINEESLYALLEKAGRRASPRRHVLVSMAQPLKDGVDALDVFLNAFPEKGFSMFWSRPASEFSLAASGEAYVMTAGGESRFQSIKGQYSALLEQAIIEAPSIRGVGPLFMGGFRYDTNVKKSEFWHDFPDALLVLPRFLLTRSGTDTWLTVNTVVRHDTELELEAEAILGDMQFVIRRRIRENNQPQVFQLAQGTKAGWRNRVHTALKEIETGELVKVVLSRRKVLHARGMFSLDAALQRLCTQYPECSVFAVCTPGSAFIGASPEDLAGVQQGNLSVACLASSTARGVSEEEDARMQEQLFKSRKERAEHEVVISMIAGEMNGLCTSVTQDIEPRIIKLKNIQHLLTRFNGVLKPGLDVVDAVGRLHPTPAVAGVPTGRGLNFINDIEGDRGWYAAPIGWLDRNGEGEFTVAIRSALVDGNRAFLYAGCGIVTGSNPEREYEETELKFEPMLSALGHDHYTV